MNLPSQAGDRLHARHAGRTVAREAGEVVLMLGNNLWSEDARRLLLHLHPQEHPHGPAEIRGSPEALRRLADACLKAAGQGQSAGGVEVEMMASDGEHYGLTIRGMSDRQIDAGPLPYVRGYRE